MPDITKLVIRAAENLDDPAEIAHVLLHAAYSGGIGVFMWELERDRLLWSQAMYEVYSLDPDSFDHTGATWLSTIHPEDLPRLYLEVRAALTGERPYDTVFRVRDPAGGWRFIKGTAWVERGADGRPLRMAGINRDVSDEHRFNWMVQTVQQVLAATVGQAFFATLANVLCRALEVRHAFVAEVSPHPQPERARVVAAWLDGAPLAPYEFDLAGTPCEQVLTDGIWLFPCDIQARFPDNRALRELGAQSYVGVPLLASDGRVLGLMAVIDDRPARYPDTVRRLLELFSGRAGAELERLLRDMEVARLNAELEARVNARTGAVRRTMRELEAFTYSVSHDLNAPLRAINGFGTILREDYAAMLDASGRDYLDRVLGAGERMGRLLEDLVNLSKISLRPLNVGKVHLGELAQDIADDLASQSPRPALRFEVARGLTVHGDGGLLRILLDCLLRNAWRFTEQVEAPLIELFERMHEGHREIVLRDNGAGFDASATERLFAPFQRFHGESGMSGGGSGLAIAQRVVHRHHGGIRVESRPGEGATFSFWLPPPAELVALLESDAKA